MRAYVYKTQPSVEGNNLRAFADVYWFNTTTGAIVNVSTVNTALQALTTKAAYESALSTAVIADGSRLGYGTIAAGAVIFLN
jgi:hypothetical protein